MKNIRFGKYLTVFQFGSMVSKAFFCFFQHSQISKKRSKSFDHWSRLSCIMYMIRIVKTIVMFFVILLYVGIYQCSFSVLVLVFWFLLFNLLTLLFLLFFLQFAHLMAGWFSLTQVGIFAGLQRPSSKYHDRDHGVIFTVIEP